MSRTENSISLPMRVQYFAPRCEQAGRSNEALDTRARTPLEPAPLAHSLSDPTCGGYAAFEGWVRDHNEGQRVPRLEYEAYTELAVREGERCAEGGSPCERRPEPGHGGFTEVFASPIKCR